MNIDTHKIYQKIKKNNGEAFARAMRDHHNGLFEVQNIVEIVRYAGHDAKPLLPYLMQVKFRQDQALEKAKRENTPCDPFELLREAGYDAFHANSEELKNRPDFKRHFAKGELLCTFNDASRHKRYHIIHAVRHDADDLNREEFRGIEKRQDAYGTSVISIQIVKDGGFISIKNRYNHTVDGCNNTFNSDPDNIIDGLSDALKNYFDVKFETIQNALPDTDYVLMGGLIVQYNFEHNTIYYGDGFYAKDGEVHVLDKGSQTMFGYYYFCNQSKTMIKIDSDENDNFANDFNRDYADVKNQLYIHKGNLYLGDECLIEAEKSLIIKLKLDRLVRMGDGCLMYASSAKHINLPNLVKMGDRCLRDASSAKHINLPNVFEMGDGCLMYASSAKHINLLNLVEMGEECLRKASSAKHIDLPNVFEMGNGCLQDTSSAKHIDLPNLVKMGGWCLWDASSATHINLPNLVKMGDRCLRDASSAKHIDLPNLVKMGDLCLRDASSAKHINLPNVFEMGDGCLWDASSAKHINLLNLVEMGEECLRKASSVKRINLPNLVKMGDRCLHDVRPELILSTSCQGIPDNLKKHVVPSKKGLFFCLFNCRL